MHAASISLRREERCGRGQRKMPACPRRLHGRFVDGPADGERCRSGTGENIQFTGTDRMRISHCIVVGAKPAASLQEATVEVNFVVRWLGAVETAGWTGWTRSRSSRCPAVGGRWRRSPMIGAKGASTVRARRRPGRASIVRSSGSTRTPMFGPVRGLTEGLRRGLCMMGGGYICRAHLRTAASWCHQRQFARESIVVCTTTNSDPPDRTVALDAVQSAVWSLQPVRPKGDLRPRHGHAIQLSEDKAAWRSPSGRPDASTSPP